MRIRLALPVALAVGVLGMMVMAQIASAAHPRPKAASPASGPSVIAYNPCTTPNMTHGPPVGVPSCNPPVQSSLYLTVGEPTANGAPANSSGNLKMKVQQGVPGPPEDSDVLLTGSISDIRCKPGSGITACGNANTLAGPDYTGQLEGTTTIRVTDHWNAVTTGGGPNAATVVDIPFPVVTNCASTADPAIGGLCEVNTSANATVPGSIKDGKRSNIEIGQVSINDGGVDGLASTAPNTRFATAGVFVP